MTFVSSQRPRISRLLLIGTFLLFIFVACGGMVASMVASGSQGGSGKRNAGPWLLEAGGTARVEISDERGCGLVVVRAGVPGLYLIATTGSVDAEIHVFDRRGECLGSSDDAFDRNAALAITLNAGETASVEVSIAAEAEDRPVDAASTVSFERLDITARQARTRTSTDARMGPGRPAFFGFSAPASGVMLVSTSTEGDLDTVLSIYDSDGVLIAWNDDRSTEDFSSAVSVSVENGERYTCLVNGVSGDDEGGISLHLSEVLVTDRDDFPDRALDPVGKFRNVPVGGLDVTGSWECWGDADVVDLLFASPGLYRMEVRSTFDSILTSYDAEGLPLRANDDSGRDNNALLVVEAGSAEPLRARLRPLSGLDRGRWRLTVRRVGDALPQPVRRAMGPGRVLGLAVCSADVPAPRSLIDAVSDAWNFRRFLVGSLGARHEDVRVLVDDIDIAEDDLTVPRIREELAALAGRARPEDVVIFLYSGHGDSARGLSSLEPEVRSYSSDLLRRDLDRIQASRTIVLIDACNSGGLVESLAAPNRWVLVSSRVDETSNASVVGQPEATGGSLFLSCLFQELLYKAEWKTLNAAFRSAASAVTRLDRTQHPVMTASEDVPITAEP